MPSRAQDTKGGKLPSLLERKNTQGKVVLCPGQGRFKPPYLPERRLKTMLMKKYSGYSLSDYSSESFTISQWAKIRSNLVSKRMINFWKRQNVMLGKKVFTQSDAIWELEMFPRHCIRAPEGKLSPDAIRY